MDQQKAKILFDLLRSSSSEKVIKGLREIKKRLLTNGENIGVFRNIGLFKQCLKLIQRPNEEILNGTLSLLSIGCTDQAIRTEVHDNNGVLHLFNVLKSTKSEPLQLRVVRTIANQSQHKASCDVFFKTGSAELIISLLQSSKEDETKCASIRALRLLANTGEHCRKVVVERGIYHICQSYVGSSNNTLIQEVFRALAHFSRISHPVCIKQIMEGTEDLTDLLKLFENGDNVMQEFILRTILNMVRACSEIKQQSHFHLTASLMDKLAMARAPTIIVSELLNRKVPDISEEKLILALCDFCEGFCPASNFMYPPMFVGRTWSQVLDSGGIPLFVSLLGKHHDNASVRLAVLRALTGIEYVFSYKDKILKHFLAADLMPKLAEQFDEVMKEYRNVRREPQDGSCVHTIPFTSVHQSDAAGTSKDGDQPHNTSKDGDHPPDTSKDGDHPHDTSKDGNQPPSTPKKEGDRKQVGDRLSGNETDVPITEEQSLSVPVIKDQSLCEPSKLSKFQSESKEHSSVTANTGIPNKTGNPGIIPGNPPTPSSLSCSPNSNQSSTGSGHNSPTWSPAHNICDSPVFSPPFCGLGTSSGQTPWDSPPPSRQTSPCSSPTYIPPWHSPPRPTSPIRPPSDWEYEEDEVDDSYEDGRFSPVIPKAKDSEETGEDTDDIDEGEATNTEENTDESLSADEDKPVVGERPIESSMEKMLVISSTSQKRERDVCSPSDSSNNTDPLEKKMRTGIGVDVCLSLDDLGSKGDAQVHSNGSYVISSTSETDNNDSKQEDPISCEAEKGETSSETSEGQLKTPFIKLNQIKFRVRKKPRRQLNLDSEGNINLNNASQNLKVKVRRTSSICSESAYSELSAEEFKWMQLLESLVRVIGQVASIKEAINSVCREFVPRIMTYLSTTQIIHKAATQMLKTIAKNSLSIPLLLDQLFIPYVAVELGEAGDPENPSGCHQCQILLDGAAAFLNEMVHFFNHVHLFGRCEASNRLNPSRDRSIREGCVMALPHVTRCPKLLYDFMVSYPAMDLLMEVLHSDMPPNQANYMYATAAISRLATTLQLDKQLQPVKCPVCSERRTHTPEEVSKHLQLQQESRSQAKAVMTADSSSIYIGNEKTKQCKFLLDDVKDITFKLEGGKTLTANREFLSEKNDVLRGMLMGSFVEGTSTCVDLPETNKTALEMLIHFLYGCQCELMENADFRSYLELVALSQMYMVEKLDAFARLKMISAISEGNDIVMLYESGLGRIDERIVLQAICTTLVRPMKTWKRARWFKDLFQSEHSDDITHNIRVVLHHPLDINRLVCNCDQSLSLYAANESVYSSLR